MRRHLAFVVTLPVVALQSVTAVEAGWIFRPSYYSHEPSSGGRVAQYAAIEPPQVRVDPTYRQSAYRHNRLSIRGPGGTADRLHIVETWGEGEYIRPYGEWQRPFRAGATPYGPWGNPQGPWTSPFGSWVNPYGLGQLPYYSWGPGYPSPYQGFGGPSYGGPRGGPRGGPGGGRGENRHGNPHGHGTGFNGHPHGNPPGYPPAGHQGPPHSQPPGQPGGHGP